MLVKFFEEKVAETATFSVFKHNEKNTVRKIYVPLQFQYFMNTY
jgi:hypothetical protein